MGVLQGSCDYQIKPVKMEALKSCGRTRNIDGEDRGKGPDDLSTARLHPITLYNFDAVNYEHVFLTSCGSISCYCRGCSLQNFEMYAENEYHYADSECSWNFNFLAVPFVRGLQPSPAILHASFQRRISPMNL
ncbi:hypothetical protein OIU78_015323 [Salix suchowensis]|nr:hypothetical protein OIU78_015323 [Salix suchowensis]